MVKTKAHTLSFILACLLCLTHLGYALEDNNQYYHKTGPLRGSLIKDSPAPVYSDNPKDNWNVIFHLLYTRKVEVPVSNYYYQNPKPVIKAKEIENLKQWDTGDLLYLLRYRKFGGNKKIQRIIGGDIPEFYMRDRDAGYLLESPRYEGLLDTLTKELNNPSIKNYNLIARILFQQDLWNRYDLLFNSDDIISSQLQAIELRKLLGQLIANIAPSDKELGQLESNFFETVQSIPGVEQNLYDDNTPWREALLKMGNLQIQQATSSHAEALGHRRVFRVFLKGPDDRTSADCLNKELNNQYEEIPKCVMWGSKLAYGSKAMLIETPLIITKSGALKHAPIVLNIQLRTPSPITVGDDGIYGFDDLPFSVFHASRASLIRQSAKDSTLGKLAPDHPAPRNFSAFTRDRYEQLVPLHNTCINCHMETGSSLMITQRHSFKGLEVIHPANDEMAKRVIDVKLGQKDFKSLLLYFQNNNQ